MQTAEAIRYHYDVGNDFYRLWLDGSLSYSCAFQEPGDSLEQAQDRKLRWHLDAVDADEARSLLDIGCGWGGLLERASLGRGVDRCVGLTLSDEQAQHVRSRAIPGVEVFTKNWRDYQPPEHVDAIVSIGAFEHFARPTDSPTDKIAIYREFFTRCAGWLTDGGVLSLQTIAYANMSPSDANGFIANDIFPDADLPTLAEIATATDEIFEIVTLRNDRADYAWTCEEWAARLRAQRPQAVDLVGDDVVQRYERYLKMSALGFRMGKIGLLRIVLRPYVGHFGGRR
ncbi:cyclopropane-fatty-acyl-phospholipid synthase family protein [Rhodococcus sp. G-MC3]|uniref:SAM-dependent methyltransferase n=1 Tax=Rhodococcus sp. G-MC3 TaxID=3046209 RepID=UPI0024B9D42C|nr:cyclopropane-fatty-acyl-phospholipid synthase family protein [Rhodococcus sp. G-MC3]MDJ0394186.1 cyclopropane-fatty-acyl-phospholipid synthase family protein [Rhodococcus sp. G-MC3]